ncbi:MAG: cob(I)yrinic acid a,c-diamide adenosyltransferase [bacterium]|nr:cob(I)yrinic acid a,c-diamide adenosyltransferase [bacterium]MDZ4284919.1 cob(I)yrinic acid a,c-diamide adenosyltransferase [Patescibacteria group bacterium]
MLYTRKGDKGTTKTLRCDQRISKSAPVAEALGGLDECNSWIGLCRARAGEAEFLLPRAGTRGARSAAEALLRMQEALFIAQAELAGADKRLAKRHVLTLERLTDAIERELPPIKSFFIPGATALGALFDVARTVARRAERRVVSASESGEAPLSVYTLQYLNRLSSALYAFARFANSQAGVAERPPSYR